MQLRWWLDSPRGKEVEILEHIQQVSLRFAELASQQVSGRIGEERFHAPATGNARTTITKPWQRYGSAIVLRFYGVSFPGGEEKVGFEAVLARVKVVVAAAHSE